MPKSTLIRKPFLNYDQQIEQLKSKGLNVPDEQHAKLILNKTGYYSLINGYKDIFKNTSNHNFAEGTSFDDIYTLYLLDADLREIILKYILIFEKHIKSSISYHFTILYGNGRSVYQNLTNYDYGNHLSDIQLLFKKMNHKINAKYVSPQISHYLTTYRDIPLWVLTTELRMLFWIISRIRNCIYQKNMVFTNQVNLIFFQLLFP